MSNLLGLLVLRTAREVTLERKNLFSPRRNACH